jgi:hypothetical protein
MYELSFFCRATDPHVIAVTPDRTGTILPDASEWRFKFAQMVDSRAARAFANSDLSRWEKEISRTGYCLLPC